MIAACLLHDIGRKEQFEDPSLCHAQVGAEKARTFLLKNGFGSEFADRVAACVRKHRYRSASPPEKMEEKSCLIPINWRRRALWGSRALFCKREKQAHRSIRSAVILKCWTAPEMNRRLFSENIILS